MNAVNVPFLEKRMNDLVFPSSLLCDQLKRFNVNLHAICVLFESLALHCSLFTLHVDPSNVVVSL